MNDQTNQERRNLKKLTKVIGQITMQVRVLPPKTELLYALEQLKTNFYSRHRPSQRLKISIVPMLT